MLEEETRLKGVDFTRKGNFCVRNTQEEIDWWQEWTSKLRRAANNFTKRDLRWEEK